MNSKALLTINYKHDSAQSFVSSISDNQYYLFVSNHIDANTTRPFDNEQDTLVSCYHGMVFGKKINPNDAIIMIPRVYWQQNTIYDIYDHRDSDLYTKKFYVSVHEGNQWDVFKCLENGNGNQSTVSPSRTNVSAENDDFFFPSDGYRWKYMYSIIDADYDKFATDDYLPVIKNNSVSASAVPGSLDVIKVESPGKGYNNYIYGEFGIGDIRLNGDQKKYGISVSGVKTTNGYYDGCWLYISSGPGAGQFRLVDSYVSNATHNYVTLTDQFDDTDRPQNGSIFEITPSVFIIGDGRETFRASARAIIDANGNTVSRIEMIDRGKNYYHASASIRAGGSVGVLQTCSVVPIISPVDGHGANPEIELGGRFAGVSVEFNGSENGTIIVDNDYSQIGIIKNPQFNDVEMVLKNQNRDFYVSEWVYKVNPVQLAGTITTNLDGNNHPIAVVNVNSVNAYSIASPGMAVMLNYANNYQIANITGVANNYITLDRNVLFSTGSSTANIHLANISSKGWVSGFSAGAVTLTKVDGAFSSNDKMIGATTGIYAEANTVTITGRPKTFDTFLQAYTYVGNVNQGSFTADEMVYQVDNIAANARFHSVFLDSNTATTKLYFTNQNQIFNSANGPGVSNQITGSSSGAIATLTNKYLPDLVFGSGEIVYIEYDDSVSRSASNTERYQFVFSF